VGGTERDTGIPHWESKWEIENYIRQLGVPATILRRVSFMETYHILEVEVGILKGKLADPIRADKPYQTIATDDIGAFAALAFSRPKDFIGLDLEIAGSELTNLEAAKTFSRVMGKPIKFRKLSLPLIRLFLGKEFYQKFRWFNEAGYKANIPDLSVTTQKSTSTVWRNGCGKMAGTNADFGFELLKGDPIIYSN